jgi:hypothetical protein
LRVDGCDQHCVASQVVRRSRSLCPQKGPPRAGFCELGLVSRLQFSNVRSERNSRSLRRTLEIFPFTGFDQYCVAGPAVLFAVVLPTILDKNQDFSIVHCVTWI